MASKVFVESLESRTLLSAAVALVAAVPAPSIVVQGQGVVIATGDAVPSWQDFTDFGPMSTSSGAATRRYLIKNTGTKPLKISTIAVAGLNAGDYVITKAPTGNIAPGTQAAVVISFSPLAAGLRSGRVVIRSNDPSIPKDTFVIQGQGLTTTELPDGLQYATTVAGSGRAATIGDNLIVQYMGFLPNGTVFDPGRAPYLVKIVGGTDPTKWQVIQGWDVGLQGMLPGEDRTLFIPASLGYGVAGYPPDIPPNATLIFETRLRGFGPYLKVLGQNNVRIPSGSTVPSISLGTDFGTTMLGQTVQPLSFILKTNDPDVINLSWPTFTGTQAGRFTFVPGNYDSTLGGWPFTITYKAKIGTANVTVSIPSDDPRGPYTFNIHAQTV